MVRRCDAGVSGGEPGASDRVMALSFGAWAGEDRSIGRVV
jgi:hypothetical protein